jgi:hypothetical protein
MFGIGLIVKLVAEFNTSVLIFPTRWSSNRRFGQKCIRRNAFSGVGYLSPEL